MKQIKDNDPKNTKQEYNLRVYYFERYMVIVYSFAIKQQF